MTSSSVVSIWTDLCPTGIQIFIPGTHNLAPCFQQMFVQMPILVLFAVISAFCIGRRQSGAITQRNTTSTFIVNFAFISRLVVVFVMAILPVIRMTTQVMWSPNNESLPWKEVWPIDILDAGVHVVAFVSHFGEYI